MSVYGRGYGRLIPELVAFLASSSAFSLPCMLRAQIVTL